MKEFNIYAGTDEEGKPVTRKMQVNPAAIANLTATHEGNVTVEFINGTKYTVMDSYENVTNQLKGE